MQEKILQCLIPAVALLVVCPSNYSNYTHIKPAINKNEDITVYDERNNLVGIIDKKNLLKNVVEK